MSVQRDRSPSFRSRQVLVKVSLSKRLPEDFFLPKTLSSSPQKRQTNPECPLKQWYDRDDSEERSPTRPPPRALRRRQNSKVCVGVEQPVLIDKQQSHNRVPSSQVTKKQSIVIQAVREGKEQSRPRKIQRVPTGSGKQKQSKQRSVRTERARYRMESSQGLRASVVVDEGRRSVKALGGSTRDMSSAHDNPPRQGQGRYGGLGVGFDGLLTFNRFK